VSMSSQNTYAPVVTRKDNSSSTRVTGSRVLTSAEGLALLRGKEEKKQKEKEEKEKRKKERLDKRKEKEELAKKKAEEKASKASSRTQKRTKRKSSKDQDKHPTSQDTNSIPVAGTNTDETAQVALELDYECCECLGTYQEDISMGRMDKMWLWTMAS